MSWNELAELAYIVQTKIQAPQLRDDLMMRSDLFDRLQSAIFKHRLTLVAAPAGYGKTSLLATFSHQNKHIPVAWCRFDQHDDDPYSFLMVMIASLRLIKPELAAPLLSQIAQLGPTNIDLRRGLSLLMNQLIELIDTPFVLLFDDLHTITRPEIYAALDYLLDYAPPKVHIVIATRYTPPLALARLRGRKQLAEFQSDDLRFSPAETRILLNQRWQLGLSSEHVDLLQQKSEGWITALRLSASSLSQVDKAQRANFFVRFGTLERSLFELLAEEVFLQQPSELQSFLLETSILAELRPSLCRAVTQKENAEHLLEHCYQRHLFLVALDLADAPEGRVYRYHDLFAHFLRQRLQQQHPTLIPHLHARAAQAEQHPALRIEHLLLAQHWQQAAQQIEQIAEATFAQGSLQRLQDWIEALPLAISSAHPWLLYFSGVCAWGLGRFQQACAWLEQAYERFQEHGDQRGIGESLVLLSIIHQTQGNFTIASKQIEMALNCPISARSHVQLMMGQAYLALGNGKLSLAAQYVQEALSYADQSKDLAVLQVVAMQLRSAFVCVPQSKQLFSDMQRLIKERISDSEHLLYAVYASNQMLLACWEADIPSALQAGERALNFDRHYGGLPWLMVDVGGLLPRLYWLQGDQSKARELFTRFAYLQEEYPGWRAAFLFFEALFLWEQGQFKDVEASHQEMLKYSKAFEWPMAEVLRSTLAALVQISANKYKEAEQLLQQAISAQQRIALSLGESPQLVLAYLYLQQQRPKAALELFAELLEGFQKQGILGQLALHGKRLLVPLLMLLLSSHPTNQAALRLLSLLQGQKTAQSLYIASTDETLTPREVEVLGLMLQGASNRSIAQTLVISLPTVKTHVSRILAKLGVQSRSQAIAQVRELHLL